MRVCPECEACLDDTADSCPQDGTPLEQPFAGNNLIDGRYRLECRIGRGGMGAVYRARHVVLDKCFALKLLNSRSDDGNDFIQRFKIEARALGRLKHAQIVDVTDYGVDCRSGGMPFLVMEYLAGQTLEKRIRDSDSVLSFDEAMLLLYEVAEAIDYAHTNGVLHCDLKPANIFLAQNDAGMRSVKILDFGLARLVRPIRLTVSNYYGAEATTESLPVDSRPSHSGPDSISPAIDDKHVSCDLTGSQPSGREEPAGTPAYMAPEIICGNAASEASDLYSFGVVIYQLIVGQLPFSGTPTHMIHGHVSLPPPDPRELRSEISEDLAAAILSPLEKNPTRRPKSARETIDAIRDAKLRLERSKWLAREIPTRLLVAVTMAVVMILLWLPISSTALISSLERRTVDLRFATSPLHPPDPRVVMLHIDEDTLALDPTPLANRADEVGRALQRIIETKAAGVAVDFLLPYMWSRSEVFSQLVLKHADRLTLAVFSNPSSDTIGMECLAGLTAAALGPARSRSIFGLVNLQEDADGITRQAQLSYPDLEGINRDSWAARAARCVADLDEISQSVAASSGLFWIDYLTDWQRIEHLSWKDLGKHLGRDPSIFRNRLVLVGGDYVASGDDYHRIPIRREYPIAVSGIVLEAIIVNTILRGLPIRDASTTIQHLLSAVACFLVLAGSLCSPRLAGPAYLVLSASIAYGAMALLLFRWLGLIIPICSPLGLALAAFGIAILLRSRLAPYPSIDKEA